MRKCSDFTHFCLLARAFRTRCSSSTCSSSTCSNAISLPLARFAAAASHCFLRRERVCGCLGVSTRVLLHQNKKTSASLGKAFVPYFLNFVIGTNLIVGIGPRGSNSFTLGCGGGSINSGKRSNNPPGGQQLPTIAVLCVCKNPQCSVL